MVASATMPRDATGTVYLHNGKWRAKFTVGSKRPSFALAVATEEEAHERAAIMADVASRLDAAGLSRFTPRALASVGKAEPGKLAHVLGEVKRLIKNPPAEPEGPTPDEGPTFKDVAKAWTSGKLHKLYPDHVRKKTSFGDDVYRLDRHVLPIIGDTPIAKVTLADAERVLRRLPAKLTPGSRRQVAQLVSRVLSLAVYPMRLRASSPIPRGFLPKVGDRKAKGWLYPSEEAALLACRPKDDAPGVPLETRVLYGFLAREGMRYGEASRLQWVDLDLRTGTVKLDENKTRDPRTWKLGDDVREALARYKKRFRRGAKSEDHVFLDGAGAPLPDRAGHKADELREHLELAGIDRPELFQRTRSRLPIRVHDLRATFVTLALASDRTETWVADRTGHRSSTMIGAYRRSARTAAELNLGWLAPMHLAIPELATRGTEQTPETSTESSTGSKAKASGRRARSGNALKQGLCTRGESNPHAFRRRNLNRGERHRPDGNGVISGVCRSSVRLGGSRSRVPSTILRRFGQAVPVRLKVSLCLPAGGAATLPLLFLSVIILADGAGGADCGPATGSSGRRGHLPSPKS
jgi:integrase